MTSTWFDPDPARMPLGRLVGWTSAALTRFHQRQVAEHGLTSTSLNVLGALAQADAVSHRELAAHLGVTPATLTPVVDALEGAGDLVRERTPSDRRVVRLAITPTGREHLLVAFASVERTYRDRMPHPARAQQAIIREYLLAVLAAVGEDETGQR